MAIIETVLETICKFAMRHFGALQMCWLCLAATLGVGWFSATNFASAGEVAAIGAELAELKGDSIAKRIFDYRVRQCDTPQEQRTDKRWLAEQIRVDVEKYEKVTRKQFVLPACGDL